MCTFVLGMLLKAHFEALLWMERCLSKGSFFSAAGSFPSKTMLILSPPGRLLQPGNHRARLHESGVRSLPAVSFTTFLKDYVDFVTTTPVAASEPQSRARQGHASPLSPTATDSLKT